MTSLPCLAASAKLQTLLVHRRSLANSQFQHIQILFHPHQLHDGVPLTHHAIFFHTISFPISSPHPFRPTSPPSFPPPPGVWNGSTTRGVVFALCGRYFHSPTDTKELLYDPASVMNGDTLKFCLKEAWCKLSFFVLSFFYYLYW